MRLAALVLAVVPWSSPGADLPPAKVVQAALDGHPSVLAARAAIAGRHAAQRALQAGSHELNMRLAGASRRDRPTGQDLADFELGVERGIRSGRKAALDAELGAHGVAVAGLAVEEAKLEAARDLLRLWFEWARVRLQAEQWRDQTALLVRQLEVVDRRVRAGDAPAQERLLAQAALAQAESHQLQLEARSDAARIQLLRAFPTLPVPEAAPHMALEPVDDEWEARRLRALQRNPELAVTRAESARLRTSVARAQADLVPDPTVGMRLASERGGDERVVGFSVAIALPGEARHAAVDGALAELGVAAQREALALRRVEAQIGAIHALAARASDAARRAQVVAEGLQRNAELSGRAYALGEASMAEVLAARRLALEAGLAAALVRTDAAEARYRLALEAGELWVVEP